MRALGAVLLAAAIFAPLILLFRRGENIPPSSAAADSVPAPVATPVQRVARPTVRLEKLPTPDGQGRFLNRATVGDIETLPDAINAANKIAAEQIADIPAYIEVKAAEATDAVKRFFGGGEKRRLLTDPVLNAPPQNENGDIIELSAPNYRAFTARYKNAPKYAAPIVAAARRYDISPAWLAQVLIAESSLVPTARATGSTAGGLGQFVDATWRQWSKRVHGFVGNKFDGAQAIPVAAAYLADLQEEFGSEYEATIAYHWGRGHVARNGAENAPLDKKIYAQKIAERAGFPRPTAAGEDEDFVP